MTKLSTILLAATALACPTTAFAQSQAPEDVTGEQTETGAADNSGDIVVTAMRRETRLQDTPLAVSAIGAENLETRGVNGLTDLSTGSVPGMNFVPFAGTPSIIGISARGINVVDPTQGTQEMAVPIYIDGVPLGRGQGLGLDLIDPERIEFLRGPQGQLFGRNAEAGAVQFVSRRPSGELGVDASLQIGSYGLDRERLRVDLPEFAGIRLQASLIHSKHNAYTRNVPKGVYSQQADYGLLDSFGYRIAAEFSPVDNLRFNYVYDNADIDDSQPYLVWVPVDIVGRPPFSPQPAGFDYPSRVNSPIFNEIFNTRSSGHALTIQYDATANLTFKSITSYRKASRHGSSTLGDALVAGGSSTGIVRSNAREDVEQNQWYQEVQAIGSWDRLDVTIGGTYFKEKVDDERRSYLTGPGFNAPALGLSASLRNCVGLERCLTARSEQNATSTSYGIYGQASYRPFDRLELTAGIRYSDDSKVAERTYIQPLALPPYLESSPSGALPPIRRFDAKRWDPAFSVKYDLTSDINAYVRYATAYRAGGTNVRSSIFAAYKEEEIETWEVGLKSQFLDRRVTFNLALYHNRMKGLQTSIQEAPSTNPSLTATVNRITPTKTKGVEAELFIRPTDNLTLSAGYSLISTPKWVEFDNPLTAAVDVARFYTTQAPRHSGNFAADYETGQLPMGKLALHLDYAWATGHWSTGGGILVSTMGPDYVRPAAKTNMLNGRISLKDIPAGAINAEVAVFGKNLLKDTNYTYGFDGAASGGGFGAYLNAPRTFGVEFRVKY